MGGLVLGVLAWQEGGESVAALIAAGWRDRRPRVLAASAASAKASRPCSILSLFASKLFSFGIAQGILQQIALGGMLIALPIYLQLVLGYNALEAGCRSRRSR